MRPPAGPLASNVPFRWCPVLPSPPLSVRGICKKKKKIAANARPDLSREALLGACARALKKPARDPRLPPTGALRGWARASRRSDRAKSARGRAAKATGSRREGRAPYSDAGGQGRDDGDAWSAPPGLAELPRPRSIAMRHALARATSRTSAPLPSGLPLSPSYLRGRAASAKALSATMPKWPCVAPSCANSSTAPAVRAPARLQSLGRIHSKFRGPVPLMQFRPRAERSWEVWCPGKGIITTTDTPNRFFLSLDVA